MKYKTSFNMLRIALLISVVLLLSIACSDDGAIDKIPSVTTVEPLMGPKTTVVTITGTNFSSTPEENKVTFNGKSAFIISATSTLLKVEVPAGSGDGPIAISVRGKEAPYQAEFKYQWSKEIFAGSVEGYLNGPKLNALFKSPESLAIDNEGNLYVCDNKTAIRKINEAGEVSLLAGGSSGFDDGVGAAAKFTELNGITVDDDENIYVVDYTKVRKITKAGVVSSLAGSTYGYKDGQGANAEFSRPRGIVVGKDNSIYVTDIDNHVIRKITPNGEVSTMVGSTEGYKDGKGADAKFHFPRGMTADNEVNFLYVFDSNNVMIRKIAMDGTVSTLIGDGNLGYRDGPLSDAEIGDGIRCMAFDKDMNLYWTEAYNDAYGDYHLVRKLSASGIVSTLIQNETFSYHGIAVDDAGAIYVTSDYKIFKID